MNSVTATFLIILSAGASFFFTKPMVGDLQNLLSQKGQYEEALVKLNSVNEIQKKLTDKLDSMPAEEKEKLKVLLPDSPGTVKLVSDIAATASQHGIAIEQISYVPTNNDSSQSVSGAAPATLYKSVTLSFTFSADYAHLKDFLSDLESSLRLIDVRSIDINVGEKGTYNYRIDAQVYSL